MHGYGLAHVILTASVWGLRCVICVHVLQVARVLHYFLYGGCCSTDDLVSEIL